MMVTAPFSEETERAAHLLEYHMSEAIDEQSELVEPEWHVGVSILETA